MTNLKSELEKGCELCTQQRGIVDWILEGKLCPICEGKKQLLSKIVEMIKEKPYRIYRDELLQSLVGSEVGK